MLKERERERERERHGANIELAMFEFQTRFDSAWTNKVSDSVGRIKGAI
jgi:hypothetical protein